MQFFIGPMSKNVVDTVIKFADTHNIHMTFIPSRRQIEYDGGYVNNWTTRHFTEYVKSKNPNIVIERDHCGPGQGATDDDGYASLDTDVQYMDVIHIDPWKKYPAFEDGLKWTIDMINYCDNLNPNLLYEIATEEGIRKFEVQELEQLINRLQEALAPEVFKKIKYLVIQCGTKLSEKHNIGSFDADKLRQMIALADKYHLTAKEHNGDWITDDIIAQKYDCGLRCINIAPEFGEIETAVLLKYFKEYNMFEEFYNICLNSKKWIKWVSTSFTPEKNKEQLVLICGHYTFAYPEFLELKHRLISEHNVPIDELICAAISLKLDSLYKNYLDIKY
jgi:hypothetical protein